MDILKKPIVALVEAKKDDFEKGTAQCLIAMKVCQIINAQADHLVDIHGIVTNSIGWRFYTLTLDNQVYESSLYAFPTQTNELFGILETIFKACEIYLQ